MTDFENCATDLFIFVSVGIRIRLWLLLIHPPSIHKIPERQSMAAGKTLGELDRMHFWKYPVKHQENGLDPFPKSIQPQIPNRHILIFCCGKTHKTLLSFCKNHNRCKIANLIHPYNLASVLFEGWYNFAEHNGVYGTKIRPHNSSNIPTCNYANAKAVMLHQGCFPCSLRVKIFPRHQPRNICSLWQSKLSSLWAVSYFSQGMHLTISTLVMIERTPYQDL